MHGVELVAVEWLQGPGRGILRLYIDRPGGDPRVPPSEQRPGATADICAHVSRDVGAVLDTLDVIEGAYDLEVGSPGFERPVQKRADFDRFKGLKVRISLHKALAGSLNGQRVFEGTLEGTREGSGENYRVVIALGPKGEVEIPRQEISRARLVEIKAEKPAKPGKGPKKPKKQADAADPKTSQTTEQTTTATDPSEESGESV